MAVIENIRDIRRARTEMMKMDRATLIAQQLVQRGGEHAIKELLKFGATQDNAAAMLRSLQEYLIVIHEVARERGIELIGYQEP